MSSTVFHAPLHPREQVKRFTDMRETRHEKACGANRL